MARGEYADRTGGGDLLIVEFDRKEAASSVDEPLRDFQLNRDVSEGRRKKEAMSG